MLSPEIFVPETENRAERTSERTMFLENMLQMAWFEERYDALQEGEKAMILERIRATASGGELQRIDSASEEEKKQIILEDMILSQDGEGGREREWYREVFLKLPEADVLLDRLEKEPEVAARRVEELYRQSLH